MRSSLSLKIFPKRKSKFAFSPFLHIVICLLFCISAYSQQFSFPQKLYSDLTALYKALPQLAQQVLTIYTDPAQANSDSTRANYYDSAFRFQLVAQNYAESIALIDSMRKYNEWDSGNKAIGIEFESYASAKNTDDDISFEQEYLQTFKNLYNSLSNNREKIFVDFLVDTSDAKSASKNFHHTVADLKSKKADSISFKDAEVLLYNYNSYNVYSAVVPVIRTFLKSTNTRIQYPLIKSSKWSGVVPVNNLTETPDPALNYKLLMELTSGIKNKKDSFSINNINIGLAEVARLLNLHLAAGIPKKNIDVVVVVHGNALNALLNNESYAKKYKVNNPNLSLLTELQNADVKIIACAQALFFWNINAADMIPGVKISLTAQTVLSNYQLKNYVYYDLSERN